MNAVFIWVGVPLLAGSALILIRNWLPITNQIGGGLMLALGVLAWILPLDEPIRLLRWSLLIDPTYAIFGRVFVVTPFYQLVLAFLFLWIGGWFFGATLAQEDSLFVPLGTVVMGFVTAALIVETIAYAAILMLLAVVFALPLIVTTGDPSARGALRFLTFYALGVPFLLLGDWLVVQVAENPLDVGLVAQASTLLALGLALFLAIFPFHSWLPLLIEETRPYAATFVLVLFPAASMILLIGVFDKVVWLQTEPTTSGMLRALGIIMIVLGGGLAAFQRHLGRLFAFLWVISLGQFLVALGISEGLFDDLFFRLWMIRMFSLWLAALGLSMLFVRKGMLAYPALKGIGRQMPVTALCVLLAAFSLVGFPLLAGFASSIRFWTVFLDAYPVLGFISLGGLAGAYLIVMRTAIVFYEPLPVDIPPSPRESVRLRVVLGGASVIILLTGMFPQFFDVVFVRLTDIFVLIP